VRRFQPVELEARRPFDTGQRLDPFAGGEISGPLVPIGDNQRRIMA
jgi:hypothetical protein